jgi:TMP repeat.
MATVDSLDIQISASFRTAAAAINDLNTRLNTTATSLSSIGTNLQRQLSPMTSVTRNLNAAFSSSNTSIGKVKKSSESLSSTFTKLYSKIYLLRKGFSMFKNAVQSSMSFIEIYNYFNSAFVQVSSRAADEWQEAGYNSAEAYAESFRERAEELTTKMTGFEITENGTLKNANIQNFGMDPSQLINYQAMFAQMSSSMGNSSETAVKLSNALTMIGADLASVRNMDFEKTWNDMASGLAGMSRTLDKYGVNIRNVNLQERMHQAGIEGSITNLNQENKALLRAIILLESTEYAWADLGLTLSQSANQMRLMQANFSNLGRTIGNIFLPYVATAIKYISGFAIALQRLLEPIAAMVAAKFPDFNWGGAKTGSDILSNILDESGEIDDNFDKATKSAKKFQNQLLGFDEVYKLSEPTEDTSSSTGAAGNIDTSLLEAEFDSIYNKYLEVWEKAYKEAENPANEIANGIINAFKSGDYKGIGTYISTNISDALASINWNSVYQTANNFGTGLAQFLNGLITPDLFGNVGKAIAGFLNTKLYAALSFGQTFDFVNLGESIAAGINNFFATFDFGSLAETINVWVQGLFGTLTSAIANIDWLSVYDKMIEFLENIDIGTIAIVIGAISIKKIKKAILAQGVISWIGSALTKLVVGVPLVLSNIKILAGGGLIAETGFISKLANALALAAGGAGTLHEALVAVFGVVGTTVAGIASVIGGALLGIVNFFSMLKDGFSWLKEILMVVGTALAAVGAVILGAPALVAAVVAGIVAAVGTAVVLVKEHWEEIKEFFSNLWEGIKEITETVWNGIKEFFSSVWQGIKDIFSSVGNFFSSVFTSAVNGIKNAWSGIKNFFSDMWNEIKNIFSSVGSWFGNVFDTAVNGVKNAWSSITGFFGNIWSGIKNAFGDVAGWFKNVFTDAWQGVKNVFSTGGKIFDGIKDGIASVFKTVVNGLIGGINKVIAFPFNKINGMLNSIRNISILGVEPFSGLWEKNPLSVPQIPKLAKGAVIPGGSPFMAILGDQPRGMTNIEAPLDTIRQAVQMELDNVGSYGGYGDDYLQQMKQAAYEGVLQAIRDAGGIRAEATFRVEGDPKGLFNVIRDEAFNYARQTYTSPFPT